MPQAAVWVLVALAAVLVGFLVPALLQLRRTLATAERTLESTSKSVDLALAELTQTLGRVNKVAGELERGTQQLGSLFEAMHGLGDAVLKIKSSLGAVAAVGASIGPMFVAAVRGFLGKDDAGNVTEEPRPVALEENR